MAASVPKFRKILVFGVTYPTPALMRVTLGVEESIVCSMPCFIFTSPAGAGAKYCDEHVCLSVCMSVGEHISEATQAIFTKFVVHVACGRGSVLLRQGDEMPRGRANLGVFSPLTVKCNAFAAKGVI